MSTCIEPKEGSPSFFKVIRNPSSAHLTLPEAFVRKYLNKIPKNPTLVTQTGDYSWRTEFVKIGEDYCFALGWDKLVNDVVLRSKDIVLFWLIDPLTFLVTFLDANGCEKRLPVVKTNDDDVVECDDGKDGDDVVVGECHDDEVMADENLCFDKVLTKTCREYMTMPLKFVRAAGLEDKRSIQLKDHEGKEWRFTIRAERYRSHKYCLSAGWGPFSKYHNLSQGDLCTFTFNKQQGVLNLTQLHKAKTQFKQESPMHTNGKVKVEDECSPTEKRCGCGSGVVKVKTEYESGHEMDVVKRKRGRLLLEKCAEVKIEDQDEFWVPEPVMRKRTSPSEKPSREGGVAATHTEAGTDRVFRSKRVVYF